MALPTRFPRYQGPRPVDHNGPYRGANSVPQSVTGYREGFNKTPGKVLESLFRDTPAYPAAGDVQHVTQIRDQQTDAGNTLGTYTANSILDSWNSPQPMLGGQPQAPRQQPQPRQPAPRGGGTWSNLPGEYDPPVPQIETPQVQQPAPVQQPQQGSTPPISLPPGGLQSLVNQVQDVATTPVGGGPRLPMAQPQQFNTPQPLPANQRYPLPMQMPDGGARATADAINSGSPVPMQSGADQAVWGPGGRQYPTVTPAAQGGGQQPLSVAPRYGQSGQQAAQSLQDARQQASEFTNRGVDRIFATNGGTVERGIGAMTGPPNPSVPASAMNGATSMPYGSGSTIIRTADGRTIAAGNASAMNLLETARANGGNIPQGSFNKSMQIARESSANNPANMKRRGEVADMRSDARDRKIVTNAMRFGVRNPLAIQTAQKIGVRLPGMPRMSGDAMAANGGTKPTTQQIANILTNADLDAGGTYASIKPGFKPSAAQGDDWANFLQGDNLINLAPQNVREIQSHLQAASTYPNYKQPGSPYNKKLIEAFLSGGPQAVAKEKKRMDTDPAAPEAWVNRRSWGF